MRKILSIIWDFLEDINWTAVLLFVILIALSSALIYGLIYSIRKAQEEPMTIEYQIKEQYTGFSGVISTEEYLASFQQFSEDSYFVRISREGFDKVEFEVSTYQEAVMALENLK